MRLIRLAFAFALLALPLLAAAPAFSQSAAPAPFGGLTPFLSGNQYPLSLTLKNLDESWRTFSLSGSSDASGQLQTYLALLTGGAQTTYYTQGVTVSRGGEEYLVAYHQKGTFDYAALLKSGASTPPPAPKPTPNTLLLLSLLNLRSVGSLNDIQPFSLQAALNPPPPPAPDPIPASTSNLKQIGLALIQYTQDYDEVLPPMKSAAVTKAAIYPYVKSDAVFQEPPANVPYQPNTSLSHRKLASFQDPASMAVYYEPAPQSDGLRAVLFLDGHVKRLANADWQRVKSASHVPTPPQSIQ